MLKKRPVENQSKNVFPAQIKNKQPAKYGK